MFLAALDSLESEAFLGVVFVALLQTKGKIQMVALIFYLSSQGFQVLKKMKTFPKKRGTGRVRGDFCFILDS